MHILCRLGFHKHSKNSCYCKRSHCHVYSHKWNGCKCKRCGDTRSEAHEWQGCKCLVCGKCRDELHTRTTQCDTCAKCESLGWHIWSDGKCTLCGFDEEAIVQIIVANGETQARIEAVKRLSMSALVRIASGTTHIAQGNRYKVSNMFGGTYQTSRDDVRKAAIDAINVVSALESLRFSDSDSVIWSYARDRVKYLQKQCESNGHKWDGCICPNCGKVRDEMHEWLGCKCNKCAKTRDEAHEWQGCKCSRCGQNRAHEWEGIRCSRCGYVLQMFQVGNDLEMVKALISEGVDVNSKGSSDDTALHDASHNGHYEIVKLLLEHGANVNARGWSNWTPLHYAAKRHYNIVTLLLAHGANVNANGGGDTPLNLALLNEKHDIAVLLREHGGHV